VSARKGSSTSPCGRPEALARLAQARTFCEVAAVCVDDLADDSMPHVAAALTVLAGIAASDAACCVRLKQRPSGQNHREAEALVATIHPNGSTMAKDLSRLLNEKDNAHYGVMMVSRSTARKMVTWAERLIASAQVILAS
jgi:hypothetical protein